MSRSFRRPHNTHDRRRSSLKASQRISPPRRDRFVNATPLTLESLHPEQDQAIAAVIAASAPGDVVTIHAETCELRHIAEPTLEQMDACRCNPITITVGAVA